MCSAPASLERATSAVPASPARQVEAVERDVARTLTLAYRPFEDPGDLIQALLDAFVARLRLPAAEAHLHRDGRCIRARGSAHAPEPARGPWPRGLSRVPLTCHHLTFGELLLPADLSRASDDDRGFIDAFARTTTLLLQRYDVRAAARTRLGCDLWFVGLSPGVRLLEERLAEMSALPMPLLIHGDLGCEARTAAFAVHVAHRPADPFVEVRCGEAGVPTLQAMLDRLQSEPPRGTLFLSDVDELDAACQRLLAERLGQSPTAQMRLLFDAPAPALVGLRVIASTSRNLRDLAAHGAFSKSLWAALDYLRLRIPPLRERREDIPFFVDDFAKIYGQGRARFSAEATAALSAWHWSGNLIELERTLARLIAMARTGIIDVNHLREWAAEVMPDARGIPPPGPTDEAVHDAPADDPPGAPDIAALQPLALGRALLASHFDDLAPLHPGLQRALRYIADHFHEEIALERLARESFVSASYLCALFKKSLGMGFKRFQSLLRVERAKTLLVRDRHQRITDISLEVGFGDFSHFLRTFKRATHISPREFRKRHSRAIVSSSATPPGS
jgi:AraC-like DNA-binding protein